MTTFNPDNFLDAELNVQRQIRAALLSGRPGLAGVALAPDVEPRRTRRASTRRGRELFFEIYNRGGSVEAARMTVNALDSPEFRVTQADARRIARQIRAVRRQGTQTAIESDTVRNIIANNSSGVVDVQVSGDAFGDVRYVVDARIRLEPEDFEDFNILQAKIRDTATGIIADEVARSIDAPGAEEYDEFKDRLQENLGDEIQIIFVN